ncbi:DUF3619 family protein [Aurantivibrio plasticivorans]
MTDKEFSDAIKSSLDNSTDSLPENVREQLREARKIALAKRQASPVRKRWQIAASAIAASVLVALILPSIVQTPAPEETLDTLTYLDVDPEMLELMDLLIEFGDLADAGNDAI